MRADSFDGRTIQVVNFDDAGGGRVVEFVDQAMVGSGVIIAAYSSVDNSADVMASIRPRHDGVSVKFLEWALDAEKELVLLSN